MVLRVWTVVQVPAAELTSNITLNFRTLRRPLKLSREFQFHFNDDSRIVSNKGLDSLFNHVCEGLQYSEIKGNRTIGNTTSKRQHSSEKQKRA